MKKIKFPIISLIISIAIVASAIIGTNSIKQKNTEQVAAETGATTTMSHNENLSTVDKKDEQKDTVKDKTNVEKSKSTSPEKKETAVSSDVSSDKTMQEPEEDLKTTMDTAYDSENFRKIMGEIVTLTEVVQ